MADYDKEAAAERSKARTKELTEKLESGIKDLYDSEKYKAYLKSISHFHQYSRRNTMLIHMQMPNATRVASFKTWKDKLKRHVNKGEKGLYIYAPMGDKKPETLLVEKLDPETKAPLLDENGKVIMEELSTLPGRPLFKLVPVFDVSQTSGEPLPQLAEDLTGNVAHYKAFVDTLKAISPLPIEFEPMKPNQDGYCRYGEKIGIRDNMSELQTVAAIVHEITHARLHDRKNMTENDKPIPEEQREVEAESVAYVVCQRFGIETADNSFGYLAEWGSRDLSEFKASLDTIQKEANDLINAIDDRFAVICKERGIDLTAKEPEQPLPSEKPLEPEQPLQSDKPHEPEYTTEVRTENIAGVDFSFQTVVPANNEAAQTEPEHDVEIMPDPAIGLSERDLFGYTAADMLPLTKDRAVELFNQELTVYMLNPDNTEAMAFEQSEIENHDGIFGVDREEWLNSKEYKVMSAYKEKPVGYVEAAIESDFIHAKEDSYAIYQIRDDLEMRRNYRFEGLEYLQQHGWEVNRNNYVLVYTAPLTPSDTLDSIYQKFNIDCPKNFPGHTLSVSDVISFQKGGEITSHYVDSIGFAELPSFLGIEKQPEQAPQTTEHPETDTKDNSPVSETESPTPEAPAESMDTKKELTREEMITAIMADILKHDPEHPKKSLNYIESNMRKKDIEDLRDDYYFYFPNEKTSISSKEVESDLPKDTTETDNNSVRQEPAKPIDVPIYRFSSDVAIQNGENDAFHQSRITSVACGRAIDKAISDSNYAQYCYDLKAAVKSVIEEFGVDRVAWVLAANINSHSYDGRLSSTNKAWAKAFDTPKPEFFLQTHLAILDGFANRFREAEREKPSLLDSLEANEKKSRKQFGQKDEPGKDTKKKDKREEI